MRKNRFLACSGYLLRGILRGSVLVLGDILYVLGRGCGMGLRAVKRALSVQRRNALHAAVRYHRSGSVWQLVRTLLHGEHSVPRSFVRLAVPAACIVTLCAAVQRGTSQKYGVAVAVDGKLMGIVAAESDYMEAEEIVRKRLAGTDAAETLAFSRSFQIEELDGSELLISAGQLADRMLQNADITLEEGFGVYVNDEFQGAVDDTHAIEAALTRQLSAYSDHLNGELEDIRYADTVHYEAGLYPAEQFVPAQHLANQLTETTHELRTYTIGRNETVFSIAARFSLTPDELRRYNSDLPDMPVSGTRITVPVATHRLPIVYTKKATTLSFINYDTVETETDEYLAGVREITQRGVKGEKRSQLLRTYTDGILTATKTLSTKKLCNPVTQKVAIGTFHAQPYSTDTVIDGSGKYYWPVDGGKLTCLFGGEIGHIGLDIGAAEYSEIYAADAGTVLYAGWDEGGYGNFVILQHEDGFQTVYGHCVELLVQPKQKVKRGETIALVGSTGDSTGAHLHFEVRDENGVRVNPVLYLRVNAD